MSVEGEQLLVEFVVPPAPNSKEETESYKWTHQNTLLFLDLYKKFRKEVGSMKIKNLKRMFEEIAKEIQNITKTTAGNCDNRWKVLERSYKKFIDDSNKTGRGRKFFEYADIMHDILGKKRNIRPVLLLSSGTVSSPIENDKHLVEEIIEPSTSTVQEEQLQESVALRSKSNEKPIQNKNTYQNKRLKYNILKEIRSDRKEYYKKRLEIEEKKLETKIRKNELLEDRNKLLEKHIQKNADSRTYSYYNSFK